VSSAPIISEQLPDERHFVSASFFFFFYFFMRVFVFSSFLIGSLESMRA